MPLKRYTRGFESLLPYPALPTKKVRRFLQKDRTELFEQFLGTHVTVCRHFMYFVGGFAVSDEVSRSVAIVSMGPCHFNELHVHRNFVKLLLYLKDIEQIFRRVWD